MVEALTDNFTPIKFNGKMIFVFFDRLEQH